MNHDGFRVPDKVFWVLAGLVVGLTWGMLWYVYPLLPATLPGHVGLAGRVAADNTKSLSLVFFPAIVQAVLTLALAWFWRHPQYAHLPHRRESQGLSDTTTTTMIDHLIRHSLVMTVVLIDLIFAYLALLTVNRNLGLSLNQPIWSIIGLAVLLLTVNVVYAVWISRLSRSGPTVNGPAPSPHG